MPGVRDDNPPTEVSRSKVWLVPTYKHGGQSQSIRKKRKTYSVVVASIDSCASTSLTRRTATTLDLSLSAARTLDPLISGQILRQKIDSQPSRCVSWQTLGRYPLLDRELALEGHMFSNHCEGPVWLGRLSMEHLDLQNEGDLSRVVFPIAACHHSRNEPFGKFEPCLRGFQTSREDEANNNQKAMYLSDQKSSKNTAVRKMKASEPVYLLAARPQSFMVPLKTAVLR